MMKKFCSLSLALLLLTALSFGAFAEEAFLGVWNDNLYENEVAGITFALPEGWFLVPPETLMSSEASGLAEALIVFDPESGNSIVLNMYALSEDVTAEDTIEKTTTYFVDSDDAELGEGTEITLQENIWNSVTLSFPETGGLRHVLSRTNGEYLANLIFSAENGDDLDAFLALFP